MTQELEQWDAARLADLRKFGVRLGLRSDMIGLDSKIVEEAADEIERQAEEIARLKIALRAAIDRPKGVVPASAEEFLRESDLG